MYTHSYIGLSSEFLCYRWRYNNELRKIISLKINKQFDGHIQHFLHNTAKLLIWLIEEAEEEDTLGS